MSLDRFDFYKCPKCRKFKLFGQRHFTKFFGVRCDGCDYYVGEARIPKYRQHYTPFGKRPVTARYWIETIGRLAKGMGSVSRGTHGLGQ